MNGSKSALVALHNISGVVIPALELTLLHVANEAERILDDIDVCLLHSHLILVVLLKLPSRRLSQHHETQPLP
jgi:hypothetical protein